MWGRKLTSRKEGEDMEAMQVSLEVGVDMAIARASDVLAFDEAVEYEPTLPTSPALQHLRSATL